MGFATNFVLISLLIASGGFLLCATYQLSDEEAELVGWDHLTQEEVKGRCRSDRSVGIHLGTTSSSVAVFKHPGPREGICNPWETQCSPLSNSDIIEVVSNERGSRTTPSCVAFTDSGVLIGEPAKDQEAVNPERTICGIFRLLGKRFDDRDVQSYIKTLPYKVVNKENKPHVQVKFKNGETKLFRPEEICAMILHKMKEIAEAYMGNEIELAVVMAHQSDSSYDVRRPIEVAGEMIGLKVAVPRSNATLAAILARRLWVQDNLRVLVYNLGSTGFDASLIDHDIDEGVLELVALKRDRQLGGQAFDKRVVDYFVNLIKSKYKKDISQDTRALGKLRIECEKAKISLSNSDRVMIKIESLADGIMLFEEPLTRETFEELNMDLFNKTIELVRSVVNEGDMVKKRHLDEIVLVGGSTRIPRIQHMLMEEFGREPLKDVNPDETLAFAATHMAGFYTGKLEDVRFGLRVSNSLSVGIEAVGGVMATYVDKGQYLPARASRYVTTYHDGQTTIEIKVFEGGRPLTKHCHYLGSLRISDLPHAPRGVTIVEVQMEVDINRNVRVTAQNESLQEIKSIVIPAEQRYNTVEKIYQAYSESLDMYKEDKSEKAKVEEAIGMVTPPSYSTEPIVVNT